MNEFDFKKQLVMSAGTSITDDVGRLLLEKIPGSQKIIKANTRDDKSGTDYWIEHARGTPISIDVKVRNEDPVQKRGKDDLALETWSVIGTKIGWTLDETKRTDYILWWFAPTRRWVLVPFMQLQAVFKARRDEWTLLYRTFKQRTVGTGSRSGWYSECVFVPRREVWAAIYADFGSSIAPSNDNLTAAVTHVDKQPPALFSTAICDYCKQPKTITLQAETTLTHYGLKQYKETRKFTICSSCWIAGGFKSTAVNDNTAEPSR